MSLWYYLLVALVPVLALVAMQLTGHKTRSVFERYNIVSDGDLRDAAARLDLARDHKSDHTFPAAGRSADPTRQIS